jgi:hypothetical protein
VKACLAPWAAHAEAHAHAIERLFATPNIIPTLFSSIKVFLNGEPNCRLVAVS